MWRLSVRSLGGPTVFPNVLIINGADHSRPLAIGAIASRWHHSGYKKPNEGAKKNVSNECFERGKDARDSNGMKITIAEGRDGNDAEIQRRWIVGYADMIG